jgi:hypothetical protein
MMILIHLISVEIPANRETKWSKVDKMITHSIITKSTTTSTTKLTISTLLVNSQPSIRTIQVTITCLRRKDLIKTLQWVLTKDLMEVEEVYLQFFKDNSLRSIKILE